MENDARGARQRILIVEDDPGVSLIFRDGLESEGFRAEQAFSVAEALAKLSEGDFDCVLLDLHLSGETSEPVVEFLRERQEKGAKALPVIVVSAMPDPEILGRIRQDVTDVLRKPVRIEALSTRIRGVITAALG